MRASPQAEGDSAKAIALLRQAAALEEAHPYMEPPYWHYPVAQTLGAVLLADGQGRRGRGGVRDGARADAAQRLGALRSRRGAEGPGQIRRGDRGRP